jgi:thiamine biosynthesis lipoprotein
VIERRAFRAMGTDVELFLAGEPSATAAALLDSAEREFERLEALFSRFRPNSELSELNRSGRIAASEDLLEVVELALGARERTGGRFDPTVHDALVAAGYDRTFDELVRDGASDETAARCGGAVTVTGRTIELEPGFRLDLGGIGKGYAVDRAAAFLAVAGPALVNAGGDIAALGRPDELGWRVGIETGGDPITVALEDAAIATTGRDRRRWRRNGRERHHVIDPATGRPAETDLLRVTVVAPTAVEAEVLAKSLFLGGERDAAATAVLVSEDGHTAFTGALA